MTGFGYLTFAGAFRKIGRTLTIVAVVTLPCCLSGTKQNAIEKNQWLEMPWVELGFSDSLDSYSINREEFVIISQSLSKDSLIMHYPHVILYLFDGNCSGCIIDFLNWNDHLINHLVNESVLVCYVLRSANSATLSYFLEESRAQMPKDYIFILDDDGNSSRILLNPLGLDSSCTVILISNTEKKAICGDPFKNENLLQQFKQMIKTK